MRDRLLGALAPLAVFAALGCQGSGASSGQGGATSAPSTAPTTSRTNPGTAPVGSSQPPVIVPAPVTATLTVATGAATLGASTVAAGSARVAALQVHLAATGADVTVDGLTVEATGTAVPSRDVDGIELAIDEDRDGRLGAKDTLLATSAKFTSTGVATVASFATLVAKGGARDLLVLVTLSPQAPAGGTLTLAVRGALVQAQAGTTTLAPSGTATSAGLALAALPPGTAGDVVWFDDALPAGAQELNDGGDAWLWVGAQPAAFTGLLASQSNVAAGEHQHTFNSATATLSVAHGDVLVAYVYLDPQNPPTEIMLQWNDGNATTSAHRAYWGADSINWSPRVAMGALPATGQWVRLEVPAGLVGADGKTLGGMGFTCFGGRATWDHAGKCTPKAWVNGAIPKGAGTAGDGGDSWQWISSNPAPILAPLVHQSNVSSYEHQHFFQSATDTLVVNKGDVLYAWVYLDPFNPVQEVMLQWFEPVSGWEHRAYWGPDRITWYGQGTRTAMGALPAAGGWVKLEVPANLVGLEGRTLDGMCWTLYGGRASWDQAGKE